MLRQVEQQMHAALLGRRLWLELVEDVLGPSDADLLLLDDVHLRAEAVHEAHERVVDEAMHIACLARAVLSCPLTDGW